MNKVWIWRKKIEHIRLYFFIRWMQTRDDVCHSFGYSSILQTLKLSTEWFLFTLFSSNTWKTMNILHLEAQSVKSVKSDWKEKSTYRQIERFHFCEFCNKTYICDLFLKKKKIYQFVSYRHRRIWKNVLISSSMLL